MTEVPLGTRNEVRLPDGRIDCELNHPRLGWIPFTAAPGDTTAYGPALWASLDAKLAAAEHD